MKGFFALALVLICYVSVAQTRLQVVQDSVRVNNAELVIRNGSKDISGFLYNAGNGKTKFIEIGKSLQFSVGATPTYAQSGDTAYTSADFVGRNVKVWRNGLFQYRSNVQGIKVDSTIGKIIFKPALQVGDKIYIEALLSVNLIADLTESTSSFSTNLRLNAGIATSGQNYTLNWSTNDKTLTDSPRIVGIGSSTLYGLGLNPPDRLGDKIQTWLNANTTASVWNNLAISGHTTIDLLPVANGGKLNQNIEAALGYNPDFIFVSLAGNDAIANMPVAQSMINYRALDKMAQDRGIPIFFETTQPRNGGTTTAQQQLLKTLADSIRAAWPDRYVEGFNDLVDVNAGTPAALLTQYAQSDGVHLTSAGNQLVANRLFTRWTGFFQRIEGVASYVIQKSTDSLNWTDDETIYNPATVKKKYTRAGVNKLYYRVRANYTNGGTSAYSNVAVLPQGSVQETDWANAKRVLLELGGDGVYITSGRSVNGVDSLGKYWNNWSGEQGRGFRSGVEKQGIVTTTNDGTALSVTLMGDPFGSFGTPSATSGMNFNGFTTGVGDYPYQAVYDNMFVHYSQTALGGTKLRIKGLQSAATYRIKLWGGRIDASSSTARTLEAKLSTQTTWKGFNSRYAGSEAADYDRAIIIDSITGKDSIDIDLRAPVTNGVGHLSLIDIKMLNFQPVLQTGVEYGDIDVTLPTSSVQPTGTIIIPGTVSYYSWGQISGPSRATITNGSTASPTISGLTNGVYEFKVLVNFTDGRQAMDQMKITVYPDNAGKKTTRVHFSATGFYIPGWVNMYGAPNLAPVVASDPVTGWRIASDSTYSMPPPPAGPYSFWKPISGGNSSQDGLGEVTGNNSGIVPDIALRNYWFQNERVHTDRYNLSISGLDPTKHYTIKLVGSRDDAATAPRSASYWIMGDTERHMIDARGNTSNAVVLTGILPIGSAIYIDVATPHIAPYPGTYGAFSYVNALIIQEED